MNRRFFTRREMLYLLGITSCAAAGMNLFPKTKIGYIFPEGKLEPPRPEFKQFVFGEVIPAKSFVTIRDSGFKMLKRYPLSFMGHKFFQNQQNHAQIVGSQRRGQRFAFIDLSNDSVREFNAPEGSIFNGHGIFLPDGKHFLLSGIDHKMGRGIVAKYSTASVQLVERYDSGGLYPHDLQDVYDIIPGCCAALNMGLYNNGKTIYPLKAGSQINGNLAVINITTGRVVKQIFSPQRAGLSHFAKIGDGKVFAVGVSADGNIGGAPQVAILDLVKESSEELTHLPGLSELIGEANNVYFVPERNSAVFTCFDTEEVVEFSLDSMSVVRKIKYNRVASVFPIGGGDLIAGEMNVSGCAREIMLREGSVSNCVKDPSSQSMNFERGAGVHFSQILLS